MKNEEGEKYKVKPHQCMVGLSLALRWAVSGLVTPALGSAVSRVVGRSRTARRIFYWHRGSRVSYESFRRGWDGRYIIKARQNPRTLIWVL